MNKIIFLTLAALVCGALANPVPDVNDEATQLALFETDELETKGLGTEKAIFSDFCLSARDDVRAYLKDSVNAGAARVFNLMVDTAAQVTAAIGQANNVAIENGSKMVNDDARKITTAFSGVYNTMAGSTKDQLKAVFESLKQQLTTENLKEIADDACVNVANSLKPAIEKKFSSYKKDMLKLPEGQQYAELFAKTRLENLGCITTSRLSKVASGCYMVRMLAPTVMEFLGV